MPQYPNDWALLFQVRTPSQGDADSGAEILRAADNLEKLASTIWTLVDEAESLVEGTEYAHDARRGWVRLFREALRTSRVETTLEGTVDMMRETADRPPRRP
jgi:hypothetical protein